VRDEILSSFDEKTGTTIYLAPMPHTTDYVKSMNRKLPFPPRFGEHNEEVYCKMLGLPQEKLEELKTKGIV
jgi:hypothetical protein